MYGKIEIYQNMDVVIDKDLPIEVFSVKCRPKSSDKPKIELLWMDVTYFSKSAQFFSCCLLVFIFYITYGYLQEFIFSLNGFKPFGWYLTLVQFSYYSVFGGIEIQFRRSVRKIPMRMYYLLAFLTVGTMGFSNSSLKYLNYPTQVIFKSCKLIPVMIGGIFIQKKKYKCLDFIASALMCLGLIAFTLIDSQMSPNFHFLGVMMMCCALSCDAIIGNVQEKAMKAYEAPNFEIIFYSYFVGFFYLLACLALDGDLYGGWEFCTQNPEVYFYALLFSASGYLGIQVVLTLVRTCGALTAVTVTTCRKVVSIIVSFMFFEKAFTWHYLWAGFLIVSGIYLNVVGKNKAGFDASLIGFVFRRERKKHLLEMV